MNRNFISGLALFLFVMTSIISGQDEVNDMAKNITWYHQAAVKIETGGKTIFIDPLKLETEESADIIFITHSHGDHLDVEAISKIVNENTVVVSPYNCNDKLNSLKLKNHIEMKPGDVNEIGDIRIEAVASYNITKKRLSS